MHTHRVIRQMELMEGADGSEDGTCITEILFMKKNKTELKASAICKRVTLEPVTVI